MADILEKRPRVTLVELLTIVAIVAVLIAALLPLVSAARTNATRSACISNMRQIARAIQAYAHDNSGKVPPAYHIVQGADTSRDYVTPPAVAPNTPKRLMPLYPELWTGRLRRYLKSKEVLICPATTRRMADEGLFYRPLPAREDSPYTTYGMNWRFSNGGALGGDPKHPNRSYAGLIETLDAPPVPSYTVLLAETQQRVDWTGDPAKSPLPPRRPTGGNVAPYSDRGDWFWAIRWLNPPAAPAGHLGGCNLALADGHVAFVNAPDPPYPPKVSQIERLELKWW